MDIGLINDSTFKIDCIQISEVLAAPFWPISWYFNQLHLKGYEGIIKIALREIHSPDINANWMDYWKFFTNQPLQSDLYLNVAHNTFIITIIILPIMLLTSYNLRSTSQSIRTIVLGFKNLLTAYLFAFLPFKSTCLFVALQESLSELMPFTAIFKIDIILFLLIVSTFRILTYIIKRICRRSKKFYEAINKVSGNAKFILILYVIVSLAFKMLSLLPSYPIPIVLSIVLITAIFLTKFSIKDRNSLIASLMLLYKNCFKGIEKYLFFYLDHYITVFCFAICFSYLAGLILPIYKCYLVYFDLVYGWSFNPEVSVFPVLFKIVHLLYFLDFSLLLKKANEI